MSQPLADMLEGIRTVTLKKAHEAFAKELDLGMNEMVQAARRHASTVPAEIKEEIPQ